ncbi:MAG: hypothetical protein JSS81_03090 [Acidobacteria bacterium]|nr:hypothetical protein [Acidobacteriota bacterium]
MKKINFIFGTMLFVLLSFGLSSTAAAQEKQTFTGTVVSYGTIRDSRVRTGTFTLTINGTTSDDQAQEYLGILQQGGQNDVLSAIRKNELGRFSIGENIGVPVNVVRESTDGTTRHIFIVFERWTQFAEYRGGYRSLDYPFGVIDLSIDEKTGKGDGTYIAAAQIRWRKDKKSNEYQVEIENFATYPARLIGVEWRGRKNS